MKKLSFWIFLSIAVFAFNSTASAQSDLVGSWTNGSVGIIQYQNQTTGSIKPGRGSIFAYRFHANGNYEFIGYMESTMYNCTTTLFNEIKGKYTVDGTTVTLNPTRDFWKSGNTCAASANKEKLKDPVESSYEFRLKRDEYGSELLCLANDKGESCFKREKE